MNRRDFLRRRAFVPARARLQPRSALASAAPRRRRHDYKALVCVFLFGGIDGNNMVIPADSAGYAQYAAVRTATSGINIAQASLLPMQPRASARRSACIRPCPSSIRCSPAASSRVLANVGTLTQPTTKSQYAAGQVPGRSTRIPTSRRSGRPRSRPARRGTGWGGRIADAVRGVERRAAFRSSRRSAARVLFTTGRRRAARDSGRAARSR